MTAWVADEEYKRIKASWRAADRNGGGERRFDFGTARQNLERCHNTLRDLAAQARELAELHERLPPGDTRRLAQKGPDGKEVLPSLEARIRNNKFDQKHWREYVTHYQALAMKEPRPRLPTDPLPQDTWAGQRERVPGEDDGPLPPDPRLPREEDPDDVGTGA